MTKAEAGRLGGLKGGPARAKGLSKERLSEIGRMGGRPKSDKPKRKRRLARRSGEWTWYQDSIGFDPAQLGAVLDAVVDMTLRVPPPIKVVDRRRANQVRYDDPQRATERFLDRKKERDAKRVRVGMRRSA